MIQYLEFNVNGALIRMCFTRMTENDTWICQMSDEAMNDLIQLTDEDF